MPISNASLLDLDCSDLTGWTDGDTGEAVSEQITFDSKSTFKFDTNTSADTNDKARRWKDLGSIEELGTRIVVSLSLYCDLVGTVAATDTFFITVDRSDWNFVVSFASDGLFIYPSGTPAEVGTNLVSLDTWQEWTFDIDISGGVANATCDVYLNSVLQASDVDCSWIGTYTDGVVKLTQNGFSTDDQLAYVDWLKIGDGFAVEGWTGKINGVTNPTKINGISVANIAKVNGI